MVPRLAFSIAIDGPLIILTVVAFLVNFNLWANGDVESIDVDLPKRLPTARFRIVVFFFVLFALCWASGVAYWAILLAGLIVGAGASIAMAGTGDSGFEVLLVSAWFLREFAFGFPTLILQPPTTANKAPSRPQTKHFGVVGHTISPLRPSVEALIEGEELSVASADGSMISSGVEVEVVGEKNGLLRVRPSNP